MSKTRSSLNKESTLGYLSFVALILLVVINIVMLAPTLFDVYAPTIRTRVQAPIDTTIVNNALKLLDTTDTK